MLLFVWFTVQDKKEHNHRIPRNRKGNKSWLTGIVKCACCGYTMKISSRRYTKAHKLYHYYYDAGKYTANGCKSGHPKLRPEFVEETVFNAMKERISQLVIEKKEHEKPDPQAEKIQTEIIEIEDEIRKLLDMLKDADKALFDYINKRITQLHEKKSDLEKSLLLRSRKKKRVDTKPLEEPLNCWDELSMEQKYAVASTMIDVIYISDETGIDIRFAI